MEILRMCIKKTCCYLASLYGCIGVVLLSIIWRVIVKRDPEFVINLQTYLVINTYFPLHRGGISWKNHTTMMTLLKYIGSLK